MEPSEQPTFGELDAYFRAANLRHGLFATYEAFALIVASMATQHAKWLEACEDFPPDAHPHGMTDERFVGLFSLNTPVIFAFHGHPGAVHQILHGRPNVPRFHVRGYREEGTTTTPFDMVVLNQTSRFHLVIEVLRRVPRPPADANLLVDECHEILKEHARYVREHFEDKLEIRDFRWDGA